MTDTITPSATGHTSRAAVQHAADVDGSEHDLVDVIGTLTDPHLAAEHLGRAARQIGDFVSEQALRRPAPVRTAAADRRVQLAVAGAAGVVAALLVRGRRRSRRIDQRLADLWSRR